MIRHFNYTNRKRIPYEQVQLFWVEQSDGILRFRAKLDLTMDPPLPQSAVVFVEAYSGPVVMRFPFGSVGNLSIPTDTELRDFPPGLKPSFRIKVVDYERNDRKLLAWARDIVPLSDEEVQAGRKSIFPVETVDLGERVWDIRLEGNSPVLQLNSKIREPRDITALAREPDFISLVYPAAIRRVLQHLLLGPEYASVAPEHNWLRFGASLAGHEAPHRDDFSDDSDEFIDEVEAWIGEVVRGFCMQQAAAENYVKFRKEAEDRHAGG